MSSPAQDATVDRRPGGWDAIAADRLTLLLTRVGQQDKAAFTALFNHYAPLIKGFAIKNASAKCPQASADELVQEVMFRVWQKAATFDPTRSTANAWIYTVMRNYRIDMVRRHSCRPEQDDEIDIDSIWHEHLDNQPLAALQQTRNETLVHDGFAKLPEEQRQVLTFFYMGGKSHQEIANETGLPLGTVKSRVRIGLQRLCRLLPAGELL